MTEGAIDAALQRRQKEATGTAPSAIDDELRLRTLEAGRIRAEIDRVVEEFGRFRDETGSWAPPTTRKTPGAEADEAVKKEVLLALRKRLIAQSRRIEAMVAEWNANPQPDRRSAFVAEYRRACEEYEQDSRRLRELIDGGASPRDPKRV